MRKASLGRQILNSWQLYLLILPALVYLFIFNYLPIYGIQIAFRDFRAIDGITGSVWVGLKHFRTFFQTFYSSRLITNTLLLNIYGLIFGFPIPIILAILINSLRGKYLKKFTQTVVYVPNFISTVVMAGIIYIFLSPVSGIINKPITALGGEAIFFMNEGSWFRSVFIISGIWQGAGWGSILYLAALAGVDLELYEAATIDGATKFQKVLHIEIPHIIPIVTMMLILNCGGLLSSATDKALLLQTGGNIARSDIIGTYVYNMGLGSGQFSYTAAIGLMVNVINFVMIITVNQISKRMKGETLF